MCNINFFKWSLFINQLVHDWVLFQKLSDDWETENFFHSLNRKINHLKQNKTFCKCVASHHLNRCLQGKYEETETMAIKRFRSATHWCKCHALSCTAFFHHHSCTRSFPMYSCSCNPCTDRKVYLCIHQYLQQIGRLK